MDEELVKVGTADSRQLISGLEELECIMGCIREINPSCFDKDGESVQDIKQFRLDDLESILATCGDLSEICQKYIDKANE